MSGETRTIETRIAEVEERLKKALEKAEKEKAQLKQLQARKAESDRKQRTHMLIVCGAKIASLYGGHFLSNDEITSLYEYLKEQKETGHFSIRTSLDSENENLDSYAAQNEETNTDDWKEPDFDF